MAVTEVKQQSVIMQKIAEAKRGGASDEEIDRPEEAKAILSFARHLENSGKVKLTQEEDIALKEALLSATAFMFKINKEKIASSNQKIIDMINKLCGNEIINNKELKMTDLEQKIRCQLEGNELINNTELKADVFKKSHNRAISVYRKAIEKLAKCPPALASCNREGEDTIHPNPSEETGHILDLLR